MLMFVFVSRAQVVPQRRTFARTMCVRTEECASASGTPTAATVPPDTEAKTANKVEEKKNKHKYTENRPGPG